MTVFNPRVTANGLSAVYNAESTGVQLTLTHIAFGTAAYNPLGDETALKQEVKRVPIGAGARITEHQIRISAIWSNDSDKASISEIGFYAGDVLFAIASRATGGPYLYKTPGANLIFSYDWFLTVVSAASIAVSVDPDAMALLVHMADVNAHPQYLTIAEYNRRDHKNSVRVATTANLTLSGLQTIDGIALAAGDRVLVKNQSTARNNGIYVAATSTWQRAEDADASLEVTPGMLVPVEQGTVGADSIWQLATDAPITLGTTSLTFEIAAGPSGVSAGTYRSVTVDKRGRVTGGTNPTTLAGYGITDAQPLAELLSQYVANDRFGLGGAGIPVPGFDANQITASGFYRVSSNILNVPQTSSGHMLLHIAYSSDNAAQLFFSRAGQVMAWRALYAGTWGAWSEVWHAGNLQKQANAGDTTAGAVMTVGGFGVGGGAVAAASGDLNAYTTGGKFVTPSTGLTNLPAGWSASVRYNVEVIGGERVTQILMPATAALGSALRVAIRWHNGTGWSAWTELLNEAHRQTGAADATAGALLGVGAFGLGGDALSLPGNDANAVPMGVTAFYTTSDNTLNRPSGASMGVLQHMARSSRPVQVWFSYNSERHFIRRYTASGWQPWVELWHSGNLTKQANVTDTTAGALMAVGAFGLGGSTYFPGANLDDYSVPTGLYRTNSTMTGTWPSAFPSGFNGALQVYSINGGSAIQVLHYPSATAPRAWFRACSSNTPYGAWVELFHTGNVSTFIQGLLDDASPAEAQATLELVKMASLSDNTSGRLLTVGAFGLGAGIGVDAMDLNDVTTPGAYGTASSGVANLPPGFTGGRTVVQFMGTTTYGVQTAWEVSTGTMTVSLSSWRRIRGGTWGPWVANLNSSNVQTSTSDSTPGALMTVGAFGLGATTGIDAPNNDCNLITATGVYRLTSGTINAHPNKLSGDTLLHISYANGYAMQLGAARNGKVYSRYNNNGIWGAWVELLRATDKQASAADVTAGALMTVGAFGLGANGIDTPSNDLNQVVVTGIYNIHTSTTNKPGVSSGSSCIHTQYGTGNAQQLVLSRTSDRVFYRRCDVGVWGAWRELFHTGNLSVQTGAADATAGALLGVGAFGLGGDALSLPGNDANAVPMGVTAFYTTSDDTLNRPSGASLGVLQHMARAGRPVQVWFSYNSERHFIRRYTASGWQPWVELYHSGNLSPVETSRQLVAGNGLSGGGTLAADRTLSLGTPGTLSGNSSNGVTSGSHTHALMTATDALRGVIELATAAEVAAGDSTRAVTGATLIAGMLGLGNMGSSGYITLPYRDDSGARKEFIFQWAATGTVTSAQSLAEVTWPVAYPTACLGVHVQDQGTDLNQVKSWKTYSANKTGAQVFYANDIGNNQGNGYVYSWGN